MHFSEKLEIEIIVLLTHQNLKRASPLNDGTRERRAHRLRLQFHFKLNNIGFTLGMAFGRHDAACMPVDSARRGHRLLR